MDSCVEARSVCMNSVSDDQNIWPHTQVNGITPTCSCSEPHSAAGGVVEPESLSSLAPGTGCDAGSIRIDEVGTQLILARDSCSKVEGFDVRTHMQDTQVAVAANSGHVYHKAAVDAGLRSSVNESMDATTAISRLSEEVKNHAQRASSSRAVVTESSTDLIAGRESILRGMANGHAGGVGTEMKSVCATVEQCDARSKPCNVEGTNVTTTTAPRQHIVITKLPVSPVKSCNSSALQNGSPVAHQLSVAHITTASAGTTPGHYTISVAHINDKNSDTQLRPVYIYKNVASADKLNAIASSGVAGSQSVAESSDIKRPLKSIILIRQRTDTDCKRNGITADHKSPPGVALPESSLGICTPPRFTPDTGTHSVPVSSFSGPPVISTPPCPSTIPLPLASPPLPMHSSPSSMLNVPPSPSTNNMSPFQPTNTTPPCPQTNSTTPYPPTNTTLPCPRSSSTPPCPSTDSPPPCPPTNGTPSHSLDSSPERRAVRKNPCPIKNRGCVRLNPVPSSGRRKNGIPRTASPRGSNKVSRAPRRPRDSHPADPTSLFVVDLAETGRGKRERKPVDNARYLEQDSSDVDESPLLPPRPPLPRTAPSHRRGASVAGRQRGGAGSGSGRKPGRKSVGTVSHSEENQRSDSNSSPPSKVLATSNSIATRRSSPGITRRAFKRKNSFVSVSPAPRGEPPLAGAVSVPSPVSNAVCGVPPFLQPVSMMANHSQSSAQKASLSQKVVKTIPAAALDVTDDGGKKQGKRKYVRRATKRKSEEGGVSEETRATRAKRPRVLGSSSVLRSGRPRRGESAGVTGSDNRTGSAGKGVELGTEIRRRAGQREWKEEMISVVNADGELENETITIVDISVSEGEGEAAGIEEGLPGEKEISRESRDKEEGMQKDREKDEEEEMVMGGEDECMQDPDSADELPPPGYSEPPPLCRDGSLVAHRKLPAAPKSGVVGGANRGVVKPRGASKGHPKRPRRRRGSGEEDVEFSVNCKDVRRLNERYGVSARRGKLTNRAAVARGAGKGAPRGGGKGPDALAAPDVGPVVRVEGSRAAPRCCSVLNTARGADGGIGGVGTHRGLPVDSCCLPPGTKLRDDTPWVCAFCGYGSTHRGLGDLFGPYHPIGQCADESELSERSMGQSEQTGRGVGQSQEPGPSRSVSGKLTLSERRRLAKARLSKLKGGSDSSERTVRRTSRGANKGVAGAEVAPPGEGKLSPELWVHMECALWTSGVCVGGGRLRGLEEAALAGAKTKCVRCARYGATLGCYVKGCHDTFHYLCALDSDCSLQEENFSLLCQRHKGVKSKIRPSS